MTTTRDQIIQTTCDLLENQGYHATGLNEIVRESGAPKGSIYYYFPAGKEEITSEAVLFAGRAVAGRVQEHLSAGEDAAAAIRSFVETIAYHVETSGFKAGGPLTIVASETATTSERLNLACRQAYDLVREAFQARLLAAGFPPGAAASLAWTITAAIEGAIVLSRTYHTGAPLRETARELSRLIQTAH